MTFLHIPRDLRRPLAALALTATLVLPLTAPSIAFAETAARSAVAPAGTAKVGDLVIDAAWTRQTPPGARVGGGYLKVTNNGIGPDRLIGGRAAFAGRVEVHEMVITDGVMRMAPLADGLEIPPGETVELKPGGYHIMFLGMTASPEQGKTVPVTLTFARAGEVTVRMAVTAIGARGPDSAPAAHEGTGH